MFAAGTGTKVMSVWVGRVVLNTLGLGAAAPRQRIGDNALHLSDQRGGLW